MEMSDFVNNPRSEPASFDILVVSSVAGDESKLLALPVASRLVIRSSTLNFVSPGGSALALAVVDIAICCAIRGIMQYGYVEEVRLVLLLETTFVLLLDSS
jgi:hypothetical protein